MKCGLEIHQRLDTNKLFCNCPSPPTESEVIPSRIIKRRLHPVSSEIGTLDSAALFEASSDKSFTYLAPYQYSCLVELDEEPPHKINPEALLFALELANYFGSTPVDEVQVMRKTVIDGSDTSGFQRTMLLAVGGSVETSRGHVGIQTICLEEESAGIIERKKGETLYSLGRLGIPLVEIATAPEIIDGEHAKEVASIIGEILRLSGRVQRGIGTIRQDLNISVEGGARVEIKGAQELNQLPTLIENEIKRQNSLLELMNNLKSRFGEFSGFPAYISEVTSVFTNTRCAMIKKMLSQKCGVFGIRLPKHKGILGFELCPGIRYGTELSFYAKTAGVGGILHSDEDLSRYSISNEELEKLK
ncbi:MAG: Glu-tRNA(Gln) amidotransferase subunit GatE, partial [Candidatus Anstonellales archaeon]